MNNKNKQKNCRYKTKTLTCKQCGDNFEAKRENKTDNFCHKNNCKKKFYKRDYYKKEVVELKCKQCGKKFLQKTKSKSDSYCYDKKCKLKFKKEWLKIYRQTNKHKKRIKEYQKNYIPTECCKIARMLRSRINVALIKSKAIKSNSTFKLVGCTIEEYKQHIEKQFSKGMSWDNHGEWHIDHIKPISSFDITKESEQLKAFHYTNCQPLWAIDNLKKGAKII
jgi:hypothetical protein